MTRLADDYASIREHRDRIASNRCGDGEHEFAREVLRQIAVGFVSEAPGSGDFRFPCLCGAMVLSWPRGRIDAWTVTVAGESFGLYADIGEARRAWRKAQRQ